MEDNLQSELLAVLRSELERLGREIREDIQKELSSLRAHHQQSPTGCLHGPLAAPKEPSPFSGRFHHHASAASSVPRPTEKLGPDLAPKGVHLKSYTARKYAREIEHLEEQRGHTLSDRLIPRIDEGNEGSPGGAHTIFAVGKFMALRRKSQRRVSDNHDGGVVESDVAIDEVRSCSGSPDAFAAPTPDLKEDSDRIALSLIPEKSPRPAPRRAADRSPPRPEQPAPSEAGAATTDLRYTSAPCPVSGDGSKASEAPIDSRCGLQNAVGWADRHEQRHFSGRSTGSSSRHVARSIVVRGQTAGSQPPITEVEDNHISRGITMSSEANLVTKLDPDSPQMAAGKSFRAKKRKASGVVRQVMGIGQQDDSIGAGGGNAAVASWQSSDFASTSERIQIVAHTIVVNPSFEGLAMIMIFGNAIHMGVVTEHMAQSMSQDVPDGHRVLEGLFGLFFFTEVVLRLVAHRCRFFTMWGSVWNIFDLLLVVMQLVEEVILIFFLGLATSSSTALLRCVRILRALRLLRLLRVTRFSQDLRMLMTCIMNCGMTFIWACVLMTLLTYILSIYFTETLVGDRLELDDTSEEFETLSQWFGNVPRSALSLFQALTGGVDWNDLFKPLAHGSPWLAVGLIMYIVFNVVALLNLISAVFVQNAIQQAEVLKEQNQVLQARRVFQALDVDDSGYIDLHEMKKHLNNEEVMAFFESIDVDPTEVNWLFDLLDADATGTIAFEEFLNGVLRLQGSAKAIDLIMITREIRRTFTQMLSVTSNREELDGNQNEEEVWS